MIIFYKKDTGEIIGSVDGRVHDKYHLECSISNGVPDENISRFIVGWEETDQDEEHEVITEKFKEIKKSIFKKVSFKTKETRKKMIEHNLQHMDLLQKIEDITPFNIFDCKIENGKLVEKSSKMDIKQ